MSVISLVVAVSRNGVIGRDGGLPWHISSDLKRFKAITMGKPVIMGRKTWDSLPRKPLARADQHRHHARMRIPRRGGLWWSADADAALAAAGRKNQTKSASLAAARFIVCSCRWQGASTSPKWQMEVGG